ncbi:hypothetical protein BGZ75_003173 [Mortierella antarctica]|nr:hypothetical protein BGZ75_003173 [Mortierella antarctica]
MVQDTLDPQHKPVIDIPRGDLTFNERHRHFKSRLERSKKRDQIHEVEQKIIGFHLAKPPGWYSAQPPLSQSLPDNQTATAPERIAAAAGPDQPGTGLPTYQLDEFKTSATCCECGPMNKTQGRTVACQGEACGIMKDRDHNAVSNMGKTMVIWTTELVWPEHLE